MGTLEILACVAIAVVLIFILAIAIDWVKNLLSGKNNGYIAKQKTFVTIEKRYVSYYGLCGIKTDRRKFLLREKAEYSGFAHVRNFEVPEGYMVIRGSETVCGEIRSV